MLLAAPPVPETDELRAVQALVQSVGARVETIRGLKFKRPVGVRIVTPVEAREYFLGRAAKLWPPEKVRVDQAVYIQLGLVAPGSDLLKLFLDLLQEQARGYYDPGTDTFCLVGTQDTAAAQVIMAHELTHALDDQYYDIDALATKAQDDDASTALSSVVEGSGTLVMSAYMVQEAQAGRLSTDVLAKLQATEAQGNARLKAAPPYIQRTLVAPYALGMSFLLRGNVLALMAGVKAEDVNHAFSAPPQSTEQVLHPEKYWDETRRDLPQHVALRDLSATLGKGWTQAGSGSLGELGLSVLTGARLPDLQSPTAALGASWTSVAAQGWKGDQYHHYASGKTDDGVTVLVSLWDGEDQARAFQAALVPVEGRRSYRFGAAVLLIGGATEAQADALAPLALSGVTSSK